LLGLYSFLSVYLTCSEIKIGMSTRLSTWPLKWDGLFWTITFGRFSGLSRGRELLWQENLKKFFGHLWTFLRIWSFWNIMYRDLWAKKFGIIGVIKKSKKSFNFFKILCKSCDKKNLQKTFAGSWNYKNMADLQFLDAFKWQIFGIVITVKCLTIIFTLTQTNILVKRVVVAF
jgi:hypothetical protein